MRLIDADKLRLVKCGELDNGKPINCVFEWAIKDAPTVEAIPVEWLKTQIEKCQEISNTSKTVGLAILAETIKQWEKENE